MQAEKSKHPELDYLAVQIAGDVIRRINKDAPKVKDDSMPYKAQYVLEEVIKILQECV